MTIAWGVDYSEGLLLSVLKQYDAKFACRYIGYSSFSQAKILTKTEADLLRSNGIDIVSNWEWDGLTPKLGFNEGVYEAKIAEQKHLACGGPPDRPIYFSSDFASNGADVAAYYKGVASVIGLARTGAYGPYACIKYLLDNGIIKWAWQTYAWSNGQLDTRSNLYQYKNGVNLGGMTLDYDDALTYDYGQWGFSGGNGMTEQEKQDMFADEWASGGMYHPGTDIAQFCYSLYMTDKFPGAPVTQEYTIRRFVNGQVVTQTAQRVNKGIVYFDGNKKCEYFPYPG